MSREVDVVDVLLRDLPELGSESKYDIWQDGSEILCKYEVVANIIADLIESCSVDAHTGYYDPEEDARSNEVDDHTGYWYIDFD